MIHCNWASQYSFHKGCLSWVQEYLAHNSMFIRTSQWINSKLDVEVDIDGDLKLVEHSVAFLF